MKTIAIAAAVATVIFLLINKPLEHWLGKEGTDSSRAFKKMALAGMAFYIVLAIVMSILIMLQIIKDLG